MEDGSLKLSRIIAVVEIMAWFLSQKQDIRKIRMELSAASKQRMDSGVDLDLER